MITDRDGDASFQLSKKSARQVVFFHFQPRKRERSGQEGERRELLRSDLSKRS
jgi:hypothetical protein